MTKDQTLLPCPFCGSQPINGVPGAASVRYQLACIDPQCKTSPMVAAKTSAETTHFWNALDNEPGVKAP